MSERILFWIRKFFPNFQVQGFLPLQKSYFLQKNPSDAQNPFSVVKFENAFWGPEDKLVINDENIIWTTELRADSEVVLAIKNPRIATPTQQAVVDQQQGAPENEEVQGVE